MEASDLQITENPPFVYRKLNFGFFFNLEVSKLGIYNPLIL